MGPYSRETPKSLFELAPGLAILDLTLKWLRRAVSYTHLTLPTTERV